MNLHEDIPKEVNIIFDNQPSDPWGSDSYPPRPPRYFGLPMVNLSKPPLPPNKPYRWPLNYLEYVKDFDANVHVRMFQVVIRENNETYDA